jgi:hypothetical protein
MNYLARFLLSLVSLSFALLIATLLGATPSIGTVFIIIILSLIVAYVTKELK